MRRIVLICFFFAIFASLSLAKYQYEEDIYDFVTPVDEDAEYNFENDETNYTYANNGLLFDNDRYDWDEDAKDDMSWEKIALIVVVSVVGVIAITFVGIYFYRNRQSIRSIPTIVLSNIDSYVPPTVTHETLVEV